MGRKLRKKSPEQVLCSQGTLDIVVKIIKDLMVILAGAAEAIVSSDGAVRKTRKMKARKTKVAKDSASTIEEFRRAPFEAPRPKTKCFKWDSSRFLTKRLFRMGVGRNQFDFGLNSESSDAGNEDDDDLKLLETIYSDCQQKLASLNKQTQSRSPASVSKMEPTRTQD